MLSCIPLKAMFKRKQKSLEESPPTPGHETNPYLSGPSFDSADHRKKTDPNQKRWMKRHNTGNICPGPYRPVRSGVPYQNLLHISWGTEIQPIKHRAKCEVGVQCRTGGETLEMIKSIQKMQEELMVMTGSLNKLINIVKQPKLKGTRQPGYRCKMHQCKRRHF